MTKVLRVANDVVARVPPIPLADEGFTETRDLERWLVRHIDVIDPALKVVTTQFDRWASGSATSTERLDILALAQSGELVVLELKRGGDKNIHLQALNYGALVSGFTISNLGQVHADWLNRSSGGASSAAEAEAALRAHVDDDEWSDEVLQQTRLILVAEKFPPLVLTTVEWLAQRAPDLKIECHQYTAFKDDGGVMIVFDRLYPVNDLSDQFLAPTSGTSSAAARVAQTKRQARSVLRIHQLGAIPTGASIDLELEAQVKPNVVQQVYAWLDEVPARRDVTWTDHPTRPLRWAADPEVTSWSPTALRNRIFADAGAPRSTFSAADAWRYRGRNLLQIANDAEAAAMSDSTGAGAGG